MWLSDDCCFDLTYIGGFDLSRLAKARHSPRRGKQGFGKSRKGENKVRPSFVQSSALSAFPPGGRLVVRKGFTFLPKKIKIAGFFQAEQMPQLRRLCVFFGAGSNFFVKNAANTRDMT